MVDAAAKFFADLEQNDHPPLLEKATGSLRFARTNANAIAGWRIVVRDVAISHKTGTAGCVLRDDTSYAVHCPTSCSPQAWSTGTPLLRLPTMLGVERSVQHLVVDPLVPEGIGQIQLLDIPGRWGSVDAFARER